MEFASETEKLMSLRMPKDFQGGLMQNSATSVLHAELVAEQAASLDIAGRKVAKAMAALQTMAPDAAGDAERPCIIISFSAN